MGIFYAHQTAVVDGLLSRLAIVEEKDVFLATEQGLIKCDSDLIGDGTKIWHFTHVCAGAKIGDGCVIGQGCYVAPTVLICDGVHIQNNVSVYDGVTLDDGVFVGPSVVFTNISSPRSEYPNKNYELTMVQQGATIGANATIVCGVTIGCYAFIGAGAVITTNVPNYALVVGVPGRQVGWVGKRGKRLSYGASLEKIAAFKGRDDLPAILVPEISYYTCPVSGDLYCCIPGLGGQEYMFCAEPGCEEEYPG